MKTREKFGGRTAVIMALAGSAIGLGNIWRFPYLVGENGGAAFIIIYIGFVLLLSVPIFLAESVIGRSSGSNCRVAIGQLIPGRAGRWFGWLMVLTPLWIASYYSVVGGWSLDFLSKACHLEFTQTDPDQVSGIFGQFISDTWVPVLCHLLFLAATVGIVAFGVKAGIEKFSKISIPILFLLIVAIAGYSISLPGGKEGIRYLTQPDFSQVTIHTFVDALGQSFFSMSLGMGIIITYSSYVSRSENLLVSAVGTSFSDMLFAYIAGFAILPAVFAAGIGPGSGPGLVFQTLPYIFSTMAVQAPITSAVAAILFFLTIFIAALTSSVSLIEVGVAYLTESRGMSRVGACLLLFVLCGVAGVLCSLSFGPLQGVKILHMGIFDFADSFASNVLLVIGGLLSVILVGWVMPRKKVFAELTNRGLLRGNVKLFPLLYILIRYVAPLGILALVIASVLL